MISLHIHEQPETEPFDILHVVDDMTVFPSCDVLALSAKKKVRSARIAASLAKDRANKWTLDVLVLFFHSSVAQHLYVQTVGILTLRQY